MATESFRFSYTVFSVEATLDGTQLVVRTGMRTVVAPIAQLQHLHVNAPRGAEHVELLLSHLQASGKLKRSRVHADAGESGFDALVAALLARRPEIDIRGVDPDEAYRQTGATPMTRRALTLVLSAAWLVVALLLSPMIRHGFDQGHAEVDVTALDGPLTSHNVTVTGQISLAHAHRAPNDTDERLGTTSAWLPLVPPGWDATRPAPAVLEVRGLRPAELIELAERDRFEGVLRDLFWEGLNVRSREGLAAQGVVLAPGAKLVQFRGDPRHDLAIAGGVLGLLGLIVLGVWIKLRD